MRVAGFTPGCRSFQVATERGGLRLGRQLIGSLAQLFEIGHGGHRPLRSMEGLRGFAVFLVFLVHYVTLIEPWLAPQSWTSSMATVLRGLGNAGVDLFFVLSGYLIYGTLIAKPRPLGQYFARRVQRIYPTFLAVFAIYLVLSWLIPAYSKIPSERGAAVIYLIENVLLLPGLVPIVPLITVAWSLSYEMFFYLVIPLLIVALGLRSWSRMRRMLLFGAIGTGIFVYCTVYGGHVRLAMFVAGILVYEAIDSKAGPVLDLTGLAVLAVGLIAVSVLGRNGASGVPHFIVLFVAFSVLCYSCFREDGVARRVFCWTPLRWLGNMSYSYFLIHGLTLKIAFEGGARVYPPSAQETWMFWAMLPVMFLLTLAPAGILFGVVEKPWSLSGPVLKKGRIDL